MSQPPPPIDYQNTAFVDRDVEHLRLLSIFWYIGSGLAALAGCIPFIHLTIGIFMVAVPSAFSGGRGAGTGAPPPFLGWFFIVIASLAILFAWTTAILGFITARSLPQRRRRILCFVAAALACLQFPIGTTLGIFTFIVLSRPSIKASSL